MIYFENGENFRKRSKERQIYVSYNVILLGVTINNFCLEKFLPFN